METHLVLLRPQAIAQGATHYFTGQPCKWGHVAKRYTTTGGCVECVHPKLTKPRIVQDVRRIAHNVPFHVDRRLSPAHLQAMDAYLQQCITSYESHVAQDLHPWCPICNGGGKVMWPGNVRICPWCQGSGLEPADPMAATQRLGEFKAAFPDAKV